MSFTFASRQRTLRRICALTLAGTMLLPATPLLAVNAHADSGVAVAAEQNQSTGNITWGIKTSFRNYIGEPYKVSEGASYNSTDLFTFPNQEAKVSEDGNQVSLQGSGKVQYISHCADRNKPEECSLNLTLSNPRIEVDAAQGTGTLYMVVRTKNYTSGQWEGVKKTALSPGTMLLPTLPPRVITHSRTSTKTAWGWTLSPSRIPVLRRKMPKTAAINWVRA